MYTAFDNSVFDEKNYLIIIKSVSSILCDSPQIQFDGPLKTLEDFQSKLFHILDNIKMFINIRVLEIVQGMILLNRIYKKYKCTKHFHGSSSVDIIFYFVCSLILVCFNFLCYLFFIIRQINFQMINHLKMHVGLLWVVYL
jgi:hypothetical protein